MFRRAFALAGMVALLLSSAEACDHSNVGKRAHHHAPLAKNKRQAEYLRTVQERELRARQNGNIPPPDQITKNMPSATPSALFTAFPPGATPPLKGAPPIPDLQTSFNHAKYPKPDEPPPTDSPEIKSFMDKMKAANIPDIHPSKDASCESDPDLFAKAGKDGNCWWTCGGCLRDTDISVCPDKNTWGVSFDDGPSEYTANLLNFLHTKNVKATFFVIGSRVYYQPQLLQAEHMLGHEISIHTWMHRPLTTLTNEEIVAELAWTAVLIKDIIGVTPNTFRPPVGDMDDRVRAVAKSIGLTPIQWTGVGETEFDTNDWRIHAGEVTGTASLAAFEKILNQAASLNTGFIVLEHDLYQETVDMGIGYFIPLAEQRQLTLKPIYDCLHRPLESSYFETSGSNPNLGGANAGLNQTVTRTRAAEVTFTSSGAQKPTSTPGAANPAAIPESLMLLASLGIALFAFGLGPLAH